MLGRREEALAAVEEAVRLRRAIADSDPAAAPLLALSLTSLCTMLGTVGRYADAVSAGEEAVKVLRGHATADLASRGTLAKALLHVGICLHYLGRGEEMLATYRESVDLYAELAAQDRAVYQAEYAYAHSLLMRATTFGEVTGRSADRVLPTGTQETEGLR
jgi:tetratricopeptide (TPR) repeat protein